MESLTEIRDRINQNPFKTDKGDLYIENYERYLSYLRNEEIVFLEIGIDEGASLLLWAEYFPHGKIYGIDGNKRGHEAFHEELGKDKYKNRVFPTFSFWTPKHTKSLGSRQKKFQKLFGSQKFDIILDDGAHTYTHTKGSFEVLFHDYLKPGGWYILEDWGTTYFPSWSDGSLSGETGMAKMIKELYDEVALVDRLKGRNDPAVNSAHPAIKYIAIHFGQIWVKKSQ